MSRFRRFLEIVVLIIQPVEVFLVSRVFEDEPQEVCPQLPLDAELLRIVLVDYHIQEKVVVTVLNPLVVPHVLQ
jgi:hypothetical protein